MKNRLRHFTFVFTIFFFISLIGTYTLPTQFNNKYMGENKEAKANPAVLAPELAPIPVIGEIIMVATLGYAVAHSDNTESIKTLDALRNHDVKEFTRLAIEESKPVDLSADFREKVFDGLCSSATFMQNTLYDAGTQTIYMTQDAIQTLKKTYHDVTAPVTPNFFDLKVGMDDWDVVLVTHDYNPIGYVFARKINISTWDYGHGNSYVVQNPYCTCLPSSNSKEAPIENYHTGIFYVSNTQMINRSDIVLTPTFDPTIGKGIDALPSNGSVAIPYNPSLNDYARNTSVHFPKVGDIGLAKSVPVIPSTAIPLSNIKNKTWDEAFPKTDECSITEEAQENIKPTTDTLKVERYINGRPVVINQALQDAHIKGTKTYQLDISKGITRSLLTDDADELLDSYAGTGDKINDNMELVDFGDTIGQYYNQDTKTFEETTVGVIIYGVNGAHIVPVKCTKDNTSEYKKPKSGISGKEGAKDVPSWAKGNRPYKGESGKEFAKRLLDEKYGPNNYKTGPRTEFNELKKWGDRAFE